MWVNLRASPPAKRMSRRYYSEKLSHGGRTSSLLPSRTDKHILAGEKLQRKQPGKPTVNGGQFFLPRPRSLFSTGGRKSSNNQRKPLATHSIGMTHAGKAQSRFLAGNFWCPLTAPRHGCENRATGAGWDGVLAGLVRRRPGSFRQRRWLNPTWHVRDEWSRLYRRELPPGGTPAPQGCAAWGQSRRRT